MINEELATKEKVGVIKNFIHHTGMHCMTSAMSNIFKFDKYNYSEDLLFGLGRGLGLGYIKMKGMDIPIIGGRTNDLEKNSCKALDIKLKLYKSKDPEKGWKFLKSRLKSNIPSMIVLDMFYLEYNPDVFMNFHFGTHGVVVCGYNEQNDYVWIADTGIEELQPLSVEFLKKGRSSTADAWLKPKNMVYQFKYPNKFPDLNKRIPEILRKTGQTLFNSPKFLSKMGIYNGIGALDKIIDDLDTWKEMSIEKLSIQCIQIAGYISDYGTGGGCFRYIYSRYLKECQKILRDISLLDIAKIYHELGDEWEDISISLKKVNEILSIPQNIDQYIEMLKNKFQKIKEKESLAAQMLKNY